MKIIKCYYIPIMMAKIRNTTAPDVDEDMEQ